MLVESNNVMSRRNSLNQGQSQDVVVHTQVYRSRHRSGSGSQPSSRKNSLSDKSSSDTYQHYDSESYWQNKPLRRRRRSRCLNGSVEEQFVDRSQSHEEGGYQNKRHTLITEPSISRNSESHGKKSGSQNVCRRDSDSQPSSRQISGSEYFYRDADSQPSSRRNSGSRVRKGSASQPSSRRNSESCNDSGYSDGPESDGRVSRSHAFSDGGRGRARTRRGSRKNSWDMPPRKWSHDATHDDDVYSDERCYRLPKKSQSRPGSRKNSADYNYERGGSNDSSFARLDQLSKHNPKVRSSDNLHDGYRRYEHDHLLRDRRGNQGVFCIDHNRNIREQESKEAIKRLGSDSLDWRRDMVAKEANSPSKESGPMESLTDSKKQEQLNQPTADENCARKTRTGDNVSDVESRKQDRSECVGSGSAPTAMQECPSLQNESSSSAYKDASESDALENLIYSAVKKLLIPKLSAVDRAASEDVQSAVQPSSSLAESCRGGSDLVVLNNHEFVKSPGSCLRSFSYDNVYDFTVHDSPYDYCLTQHLPVYSQPAPNVSSLASRVVFRHRPDEIINEPVSNSTTDNKISVPINTSSINNLPESKDLIYCDNSQNNGVHFHGMRTLQFSPFQQHGKELRTLQSWPPVHEHRLYNTTAEDSSCARQLDEKASHSDALGNRIQQPESVMNVSDASRRVATEHSELNGSEETGRVATEHCELSTVAPAPAVLKPRLRGRRRRSRSKDYGLDPQYFPKMNMSAMLDENDCPLDNIDLECSDWKECLEKCMETMNAEREGSKNLADDLSSTGHPSDLSWGDEMENVDNVVNESCDVLSDDDRLQEKFSAIRDRILSPTVPNTVSVISHHPISDSSAIVTDSIPEIRVHPPADEPALPPRQRHRRLRQYNFGIEPLVDTGPATLVPEGLVAGRDGKQQRSRSLTSDIDHHTIHTWSSDSPSSCGCRITSPHKHEVSHYPSPSEIEHTVNTVSEDSKAVASLPVVLNGSAEVSTPRHVTDEKEAGMAPSGAFQPRVLRPRRRRARSQDYGTANRSAIINHEKPAPPLARCGSLQDVRQTPVVQHGDGGNQEAYNDNINARFEQLLDTYLFGVDGSKASGKIIRRKVKDRKKKPPRQRLKEDDKKAGETDTPERERPNISTQPIDFTPGFIKEPPVPHRSVAVTNDVDARPASDDDVARRNELNDAKSSATTTTTAQDEEETEQTVISQPALKPQLQYDYKEDQWSPLNPEGKKAYDRQFLLTLQYAPDSVLKPFGLPNLPEVVLDSIGNRDSLPNSRGGHFSLTPDFTPGYVRQTSSQKGTPAKRGSQTRGSREPRKVISIQREQVDLHRTENAYKAFSKTEKASDDDEIVVRQFRSILNKLTPQKFKILIEQILVLPINTEVRLKRCIDTIFEKAIDEPNFSVAYANACAILSKHFVVETKPNERVSFKKLLLNRCQDEFQKDKSDTSEIEAMQKEIDEATTEEQKKVLQENREYAIMKNKRRSLGNIRFIGELFKLQMLTEKIMHDCVFKLVKSVDEESLECLCRLLSTVGKILDVEKSKMRMDQYFQRIEKIIAGKQTSSRVRFMLRDVVDLRSNKWVPRRDENNPKTIEQIHREAQDEKVEKQVMAQRYAQEMGSRRGKDRMDRGPGRNVDGEGWTSIPAKPNTLDPNKMKLSKPQVVDDNIQLGPGGPQFGGWGRGSTGGGKNTSQEAERPQSNVNRFSALTMSEAGYDQKRGASGGPMGRNRMGPPPGISGRRSDSRDKRLTPAGRGAMGSRPSKERDRGEREAAMAAVRQLSSGSGTSGRVTPSGSRNQSRESSRNRGHVDKPGTSTVPQELTPEQVERKTKATIDEYLQIHDLKEAKECVKEIPAKSMPRFVDIAINHVLERNTQARQRTGTLLHDLVTSHVLSVEQYLEGLKVVLEFAEDMEIDIPKIWQYFGELIGPMVQDGSVPLSFLKSACQPIQHTGKAGKLVAEVLHDAVHRLGHIKVGELWRASLLQWSDFLVEKQDLRQFIKDQKLEFTVGDEVPRSPVGKNLTAKQVSKELDFLLSERNADNEVVFDWVESNVGEVNLKKHYFIRALMASICRSVIQGNSTDGERLKKRCFIMQRYLDHNAELELQALYGLQALVNELQHPPGVLRSIFDILYDEDIISEDAFNQWEKSTDPAESAGKGVALTSVNQFFTWLRETEEEEEQ